jgi:uncharacterized protein (TIGR02266 family)
VVKLRLVHPRIGEKVVELSNGGLTVGRDGAQIDLALDWDPRISRRHARFTHEDGEVYVEDLNSKNGTWAGDERIKGRQLLAKGQTIAVGETFVSIVGADPLEDMMAAYVAGTDDLLAQTEEPPPEPSPEPWPEPEPAAAPELEPPPMVLPPSNMQVAPSVWHSKGTPPPQPPRPRAETLPPVIVQPAASQDDKEATRSHPRFLAEKTVGVRLDLRSELKTLWTENISKGGLFVRTDSPPPRGTVVEVVISTPDGEVAMKAEVVHVVDRATAQAVGHPAGVGLAFVDVRPEHRKAIGLYVDGIADRLTSDDVPRIDDSSERASTDAVLAIARELIGRTEENDLYGALGVDPAVNAAEITLRVQSLKQRFTVAMAAATPPQLARLNAALKLLDRTATLMSSVQRRLEYDFRRGEVRAEQRIEQARQRTGPSTSELRLAWQRAFPERAERAMGMAKAAFEMRKNKDLISAIRQGRQALELDPFHEELRLTINAWVDMLKTAKKDPI